jgi:hypothetical protein
VHRRTPGRVDLVFTAGDKVVGLESKKPGDLVTSQACRRLARQIRTLREIVDVPGILLRGLPGNQGFHEYMFNSSYLGSGSKPGLWDDLVRYQYLGVVVIPGPMHDLHIPDWLVKYKPILADTRNVLSALARTDQTPHKGREPGWLLRSVKGVGPVLQGKLITKYGSSRRALMASDAGWKALGATDKTLNYRRDMLE